MKASRSSSLESCFEGGQLFRRDDPAHVFVEPLLVRGAQFLLEFLRVLLLLLRAQIALQGIGLTGRRIAVGAERSILASLSSVTFFPLFVLADVCAAACSRCCGCP